MKKLILQTLVVLTAVPSLSWAATYTAQFASRDPRIYRNATDNERRERIDYVFSFPNPPPTRVDFVAESDAEAFELIKNFLGQREITAIEYRVKLPCGQWDLTCQQGQPDYYQGMLSRARQNAVANGIYESSTSFTVKEDTVTQIDLVRPLAFTTLCMISSSCHELLQIPVVELPY